MNLYDKDGIPITHEEFARLLGHPTYRFVARTHVMDAADPATVWEISTVWIGIDSDFERTGVPLIFETAVFREGGDLDEHMVRHPTQAFAGQAHVETVATWAAQCADPVVMDVTPKETAG